MRSNDRRGAHPTSGGRRVSAMARGPEVPNALGRGSSHPTGNLTVLWLVGERDLGSKHSS
jgi:hypothetical protein